MNDDTVSINLAPFVQTVKQQLVASGFGLAGRIPEVKEALRAVTMADARRAAEQAIGR